MTGRRREADSEPVGWMPCDIAQLLESAQRVPRPGGPAPRNLRKRGHLL
jgi:hypothetical protein